VADQVVEDGRRVGGEIQHRDPDGHQALGWHAIPRRRGMAGEHQREAGGEADRDPGDGAEPVALDGVLDEEAEAENEQDGAGAVQPGGAKPMFKVGDVGLTAHQMVSFRVKDSNR
jgi:hypothetical protein